MKKRKKAKKANRKERKRRGKEKEEKEAEAEKEEEKEEERKRDKDVLGGTSGFIVALFFFFLCEISVKLQLETRRVSKKITHATLFYIVFLLPKS